MPANLQIADDLASLDEELDGRIFPEYSAGVDLGDKWLPDECPLSGDKPDITGGRPIMKRGPPPPSTAKRYALRSLSRNRLLLSELTVTAGAAIRIRKNRQQTQPTHDDWCPYGGPFNCNLAHKMVSSRSEKCLVDMLFNRLRSLKG
jgi:hypothetical protein